MRKLQRGVWRAEYTLENANEGRPATTKVLLEVDGDVTNHTEQELRDKVADALGVTGSGRQGLQLIKLTSKDSGTALEFDRPSSEVDRSIVVDKGGPGSLGPSNDYSPNSVPPLPQAAYTHSFTPEAPGGQGGVESTTKTQTTNHREGQGLGAGTAHKLPHPAALQLLAERLGKGLANMNRNPGDELDWDAIASGLKSPDSIETQPRILLRPKESEALRRASNAAERWPHACDAILFLLRQSGNSLRESEVPLSEEGRRRAAKDAKEMAHNACQMLHTLGEQIAQHAPAILNHADVLHMVSAGVCSVVGDHSASAHEASLSIGQQLILNAWRLVDPMRLSNAIVRNSTHWAPVFDQVEDPQKLTQLLADGSTWRDFNDADASRIRSLLLLERAKVLPHGTRNTDEKRLEKRGIGQAKSDSSKKSKIRRKHDEHSRECLKRYNASQRSCNPQKLADIVDEYIDEKQREGVNVPRAGTLRRISDNR